MTENILENWETMTMSNIRTKVIEKEDSQFKSPELIFNKIIENFPNIKRCFLRCAKLRVHQTACTRKENAPAT